MALLALAVPPLGQAQQPQVPSYEVRGKVVNMAGKPQVGAELASFWGSGHGDKPGLQATNALKTDKRGAFRGKLQLYRLPATVMVFDKGRKLGARLTLTKENVGKPHTLVLRPLGKVRLALTGDDGPLEHAGAVIIDEIGKSQVGYASTTGPLDLALPAGEYTLHLMSGIDVKGTSRKVTLTSGATANLGTAKLEKTPYAKAYGKPALPLTIGEARGVPASFKLEDLKGKWVLLEFWGFW
jgi:hypothetical protein